MLAWQRLLVVMCCLGWGLGSAQAVVITLAQPYVAAGSTLQLTLETLSSSPLEPKIDWPKSWSSHFAVIEQEHLVQRRPNGTYQHYWFVQLQHLQPNSIDRELVLVPVTVQGRNSQPFRVLIKALRSSAKTENPIAQIPRQRLEMQHQVDFVEAYVGQSLLYELVIKYQGFPFEPRLNPLQVTGAGVRPLHSGQEQGLNRGGVNWQEAKWQEVLHLYADKVVIQPRLFAANFALTGPAAIKSRIAEAEYLEAQAPALPIKVKPIPASWPADQPWLPALGVDLSVTLVGAPPELVLGQPWEVQLQLNVVGQQGRHLPQFSALESDLWQLEPLVTRTSTNLVSGLLVGSLQQTFLLTPKQLGSLTLPEVSLAWWEVKSEQYRLEQHSLGTVKVVAAKAKTTGSREDTAQILNRLSVNQVVGAKQANPKQLVSKQQANRASNLIAWLGWLLLLGLCLSLLGLAGWLYLRSTSSSPLPSLNPTVKPSKN